jgi:hypothetical protein
MAMHLEFVVLGPPISNQQSTPQGKANLAAWRATVAGEAQNQWAKPLLLDELKASIINFFAGNRPSVDVDYSIMGASKILVNALQAGQQFVYVRLEDPVDPFPLPK